MKKLGGKLKPSLKPKTDLSTKNANPKVGWGPWASIGVSLGAYMLPLIIVGVLLGLTAALRRVEPEVLLDGITPLQDLGLNVFIAIAGSVVILTYVSKRGGERALGFTNFKKKYLVSSLAGFGVYLVTFIAITSLIAAMFSGFDANEVQETAFDAATSPMELIVGFIALVIIPPLYEELLFRGFAFQGLAKAFGFLPAALVINGLFGLAHGQINVAVDTFVLGMIASWFVWKTKSLWPAILLHSMKNLLAFVLRFIF